MEKMDLPVDIKEEKEKEEDPNPTIESVEKKYPLFVIQWKNEEGQYEHYLAARLAHHEESNQSCIMFLGLVEEANPGNFFSYIGEFDNFSRLYDLEKFTERVGKIHNNHIVKKMGVFVENIQGKSTVGVKEVDVVEHLKEYFPKEIADKVIGELAVVIREFHQHIKDEEKSSKNDDEDYIDPSEEELEKDERREPESELGEEFDEEEENEKENLKRSRRNEDNESLDEDEDDELKQPKKKRKKEGSVTLKELLEFKNELQNEKNEENLIKMLMEFEKFHPTPLQFFKSLIGIEVNKVRNTSNNIEIKKQTTKVLKNWRNEVREELNK